MCVYSKVLICKLGILVKFLCLGFLLLGVALVVVELPLNLQASLEKERSILFDLLFCYWKGPRASHKVLLLTFLVLTANWAVFKN